MQGLTYLYRVVCGHIQRVGSEDTCIQYAQYEATYIQNYIGRSVRETYVQGAHVPAITNDLLPVTNYINSLLQIKLIHYYLLKGSLTCSIKALLRLY